MLDLNQFQELSELPKLIKNEDRGGYYYADEYIGNVFKFNNKLVFFNEKTVEEISIATLTFILSIIKDMSFENQKIDELNKEIDNIKNQLTSFNNLNRDINSIKSKVNSTTNLESDIENIKEEFVSNNLKIMEMFEQLESRDDLNSVISDKVDNKLTDVYKSFNNIVNKLVTEEVSKLETDIRKKSDKLSIAQIAMFKEIGLSIENIIEMKKNNML